MQENQSIVENPLAKRMDELLERFGSWRLFAAFVAAAWRQRRARNLVSDLSPQMRRDIGLPEDEEWRRPRSLSLWDFRV